MHVCVSTCARVGKHWFNESGARCSLQQNAIKKSWAVFNISYYFQRTQLRKGPIKDTPAMKEIIFWVLERDNFFSVDRIEIWTAEWEAQMLPLCYDHLFNLCFTG